MIRIGISRRKQPESATPATPTPTMIQAGDRQYLVAGDASTLSKRVRPVRLLGNLLIIVGVLMLLGIGGWYAYTQWDNQRQLDDIAARFPGSVKADITDDPAGTPSPVATPTPLRILTTGVITPVLGTDLTKKVDTSPPVRLVISSVKIDSKIVPITWKMIPGKNGQ